MATISSKVLKLLLMTVCVAVAVTATSLNDRGNPAANREGVKSDFSNLYQSDTKLAASLPPDFLTVDVSNSHASKLCHCRASALTQMLTPLRGPEPPFKKTQVGGEAQTISVIDSNVGECGLADFISFCGPLEFLFTDTATLEAINVWPYKDCSWDSLTHRLTLNPTSESERDLKLTVLLLADRSVQASEHIRIQIAESSGHRSLAVETLCAGPSTNMNLLNSSVKVSQSGYTVGYNPTNAANVGCDGILQFDTAAPSGTCASVYDDTRVVGVTQSQLYWKAEFSISTKIETALILTNYRSATNINSMQMTMGDNSDPTTNPACNTKMTESGWWKCSAKGKFWALLQLSPITTFYFAEVMLYSQEAIQINALSAYMNSTKNTTVAKPNNFQAFNALSNIMALASNKVQCCITSQSVFSPTLTVTLKAFGLIDGISLIPKDDCGAFNNQVNHDVYIRDSSGNLLFCGQVTNFNTYKEVKCGFFGDQVFVQHKSLTPTQNKIVSMAGLGIFSSCDCSGSSFDPKYIPVVSVQDTFGQPVTLQASVTDPPKIIQLKQNSPDTISTICGSGDGFSKCGHRKISFKEKTSDQTILSWPFKGFSFEDATSNLTFDPNQATASCVLIATIALLDYPLVNRTQEISATVTGIVTEVTFTTPYLQLIANINQQAFLQLPALALLSSYVVSSKQNFTVTVTGNQLMVLSKNELDAGQNQIVLDYTSPRQNVPFTVRITFVSTDVQADPVTASVKSQNTTVANTTVVSTQPVSLFQSMDCAEDDAGNVSCVEKTTGYICHTDETSGKFVCGIQAKKNSDNKQEVIIRPTLTISQVSQKAQFSLKFSEAMNLQILKNTTNSRSLKGGRGGTGKGGTSHLLNTTDLNSTKILANKYNYLLSDQYLDIFIEANGEYDENQLQLEWFAYDITEDTIFVQILFYDPLQISSIAGSRNKLSIGLLQSSFESFTSLKTGLQITNPLQIQTKILPTQVLLGSLIENAQQASSSLATASQSSILSNAVTQVFLSGAMDQMWLMINELQIVLAMQYLQISIPANVNLIMNEVDNIASFNVFPTTTIMTYLFTFTITKMPGVGFEAMGVYSKRLILYLGAVFLWMAMVVAQCSLLLFALIFRKGLKFFDRLSRMLQRQLMWSGLILTIIEAHMDLCTGILLSFEETHYETKSDIFDFALSIFFTPIVIGIPLFSFIYLRKHKNQLHESWFQEKYSALTEGYHTTGHLGQTTTMYMISWFCIRRILIAIVLVPLRTQTACIPLTFNLWLCIFDLCFKLHLFPFEHKTRGIMEIFNDTIILISCYFFYLFTDLVPGLDDKYNIGWVYLGLIGFMIVVNVLVMIFCVFQDLVESCKRKCALQHNFRVMKARGIQIEEDNTPKLQMLMRAIKIEELFYSPREPTLNQRVLKEIHDLMVSEVVAKKAKEKEIKEFFQSCDVLIELEQEAVRGCLPASSQVQNYAREESLIELPVASRPVIVAEQAKPSRSTVLRKVFDDLNDKDDKALDRISQPINLADFGKLLPDQFTNLTEESQVREIKDLLKHYEDDWSDAVVIQPKLNTVQEKVQEARQKQTDAMIYEIFNDL